MKIVAYTLCWNEEKMLPFYLRHYERFCDKIIIYDNLSSDASLDIAKKHPKVEVRQYGASEIDERAYLTIKNESYMEQRGKADWVIVGDCDEFFYASDVVGLLGRAMRQKAAIICTEGYEMVADGFPIDDGKSQIWKLVGTGVESGAFSKRVCFSPDVDMNFSAGCHHCYPKGKNVRVSGCHASLLHYKWLGVDYVGAKYGAYQERLSRYNKDRDFGSEYGKSRLEIEERYKSLSSMKLQVV